LSASRKKIGLVYQEPHFCCFKRDLETTLKAEIGTETFDALLAECQREFGISKRKHAIKNPTVLATIIERAREQGQSCQSLEKLVLSIGSLVRTLQ
jgi:hypothetical protein